MAKNKHETEVTKHLTLLHEANSIRESKVRLQPLFNKVVHHMIAEFAEKEISLQLENGNTPTIKTPAKYVERYFSEWVISQDPVRAKELIELYK